MQSDRLPLESDDLLGRKELAAEIAKGLIRYSESETDGLTISITGEWGSGKSTLLHFIISEMERIQNKKSIKIIEFNPWIFYKEGNIKESFLFHFALALRGSEARITSVSKKVKNVVTAFGFLKNISAVAGNTQEGIKKALDFFSKNDSISGMKGEIDKELRKSNKKIFVFIDDIDRLTHSEILELFQTISLIANFANVYYIIAFDKEIVVSAIKKDYEIKAMDYLEKIIQVDYPIPVVKKEKFEILFFQMLSNLFEEHKIKVDINVIIALWRYHGLAEYFTTLRDFKRFFNSLSLRLLTIAEDVNVHDFVAIEAIRLFDNEGYNQFYSSYITNLRKRELSDSIFKDDQVKVFKQPTSDIIKAVLPKYSFGLSKNDVNEKRIYDPAYFERYFTLLRNDGDISEIEFKEFMQRPVERREILMDACKFGRLKNLLDRLSDDAISRHFPKYDFSIVEVLINFFNDQVVEFEKFFPEVSAAIVNLICASKNQDDFLNSFFSSFKGQISYPSMVHVYFFHYMRKYKRDNGSFGSRRYAFDEYYKEKFDLIYSWYIEAFKETANSIFEPRFTLNCPFIQFLYLRDYAELFPELYLNRQSALFNNKYLLLYILSQHVELDDDNLSFRSYNLNYVKILFPGNTFVQFYEKIKSLNKIELNDRQRAYVDNFLKLDVSNYSEIRHPR